jgi:hypothetical protein
MHAVTLLWKMGARAMLNQAAQHEGEGQNNLPAGSIICGLHKSDR